MQDVEADARVDGYDPVLCAFLSKAMRLATNIHTFVELVEGHDVPRSALDPYWVRRYRL